MELQPLARSSETNMRRQLLSNKSKALSSLADRSKIRGIRAAHDSACAEVAPYLMIVEKIAGGDLHFHRIKIPLGA
jgi:hypothetical protein